MAFAGKTSRIVEEAEKFILICSIVQDFFYIITDSTSPMRIKPRNLWISQSYDHLLDTAAETSITFSKSSAFELIPRKVYVYHEQQLKRDVFLPNLGHDFRQDVYLKDLYCGNRHSPIFPLFRFQ